MKALSIPGETRASQVEGELYLFRLARKDPFERGFIYQNGIWRYSAFSEAEKGCKIEIKAPIDRYQELGMYHTHTSKATKGLPGPPSLKDIMSTHDLKQMGIRGFDKVVDPFFVWEFAILPGAETEYEQLRKRSDGDAIFADRICRAMYEAFGPELKHADIGNRIKLGAKMRSYGLKTTVMTEKELKRIAAA